MAEKDIIEKAYEAVELARSTGKIRKGANEATKVIEKGNAKLVVIAKDITPPEITMHIPILSKEKGVPCVEVPSREELGTAAGLSLPTSAVVITQEGESKSIIAEILKESSK